MTGQLNIPTRSMHELCIGALTRDGRRGAWRCRIGDDEAAAIVVARPGQLETISVTFEIASVHCLQFGVRPSQLFEWHVRINVLLASGQIMML